MSNSLLVVRAHLTTTLCAMACLVASSSFTYSHSWPISSPSRPRSLHNNNVSKIHLSSYHALLTRSTLNTAAASASASSDNYYCSCVQDSRSRPARNVLAVCTWMGWLTWLHYILSLYLCPRIHQQRLLPTCERLAGWLALTTPSTTQIPHKSLLSTALQSMKRSVRGRGQRTCSSNEEESRLPSSVVVLSSRGGSGGIEK